MINKRFDVGLKNKYDNVGKELAKHIMRDFAGARFLQNNDKEDSGDFSDGFWDQKYVLPCGHEFFVEPEMKDSKWWGLHYSEKHPFKYSSMDIPYRKAKNKADAHIVISTCGTLAFIVTRKAMDRILERNGGVPKFKKTIYEPSGAYYFSVPLEEGRFLRKNKDGKWTKCS